MMFVSGCERIQKRSQHKKVIEANISLVSRGDVKAVPDLISALSATEADVGLSRELGEWYYAAGYAVNDLGIVDPSTAHYERARELFVKADACINDYQGATNQGTITTAIANTHHRVGFALYPNPKFKEECDKALRIYATAVSSLRSGKDYPNLSIALFNIAEIHASYGDYEEAIRYAAEVVSIDKQHNLDDLKEDQQFLKQLQKLQSEQDAAGNPLPAE